MLFSLRVGLTFGCIEQPTLSLVHPTPASWSGVLLEEHTCGVIGIAPSTGWSLWCGLAPGSRYLYPAQPLCSPLCPLPTGLAPMGLLSPP